ncbi:MAG: type II secretion system F family protein, partial [Proteobacteria bacterium]|nr:type II secretion system F family protein [Pseudomonadota bacterium]
FFKQLALMLRSGLSITEAFDIMVTMQRGRMRLICADMNNMIKKGDSFSQAMEKYTKVFSNLAVQMIRSAETSGEIDVSLMRIAEYIEHKAQLKSQVKSAMMYPSFTLLAAGGVFLFLVVYIMPKFEAFILNSGSQPPPSTQFMIDLGNFILGNWYFIIAGLIILIISFIIFYRKPKGRHVFDTAVLSVPVVGSTISSASMAQISWGLSLLLKSGIPVVESLRIISDMMGNKLISENIDSASNEVLHGKDLASSFDRAAITTLLQQLMVVGERSGNLVKIMDEASNYYEDDLRSKTQMLANLVEPISIVLIGGIVGFIYYGFFKAVLAISTGGG